MKLALLFGLCKSGTIRRFSDSGYHVKVCRSVDDAAIELSDPWMEVLVILLAHPRMTLPPAFKSAVGSFARAQKLSLRQELA